MTLFDSPAFDGHEGVHAFYDEKTGLKAIIAIHSTARGPAAGGMPHVALRERRGGARGRAASCRAAMSYKNAMADLELGGGKSVIIGDSRTQKTPGAVRGLRPRGRGRWAAGTGPPRTSASRRPTSSPRRKHDPIRGRPGRLRRRPRAIPAR